jgi:hypothetical protein
MSQSRTPQNAWVIDAKRPSRTSRPPLPHRQRPPAGSSSINCARNHTHHTHNARTTRPRLDVAQRSRPPRPARGHRSHSPFDRRPFADTEAQPGDGERCAAQEDLWRPQGPGQDLPEPVRPPWRGLEERHEVRRLAQDEGDSAQGPRLGMRTWYWRIGLG